MSSSSEQLRLAAQIHLLLRRATGRVIDIEWLAVNAEYAKEIIRVIRLHTADDPMSTLAQLADEFEQIMFSLPKSKAHVEVNIPKVKKQAAYVNTQLGPALDTENNVERYVYGLR
ncbi:hypothetical protein TI05_12455 [Achromatium sp. WMS3]|nr:hypothetical protein TI05_12455 [Achromatium sp. WMS3]